MTAAVEERPLTEANTPAEAEKTKTTPNIPLKEEYASFDDLLNKPARERDLTITAGERQLKVHLRAIGSDAYDQLVASSPPTRQEDKDRGMVYDLKTFAPKLIAAVVSRPKMNLDQANRLYADPNWSGGEAGGLYAACVEICQAGINVPFSASG